MSRRDGDDENKKIKKPKRMKDERCCIGVVGGGKRILVIASRPLNLSLPPSEPTPNQPESQLV
jgi:hypothetical protein